MVALGGPICRWLVLSLLLLTFGCVQGQSQATGIGVASTSPNDSRHCSIRQHPVPGAAMTIQGNPMIRRIVSWTDVDGSYSSRSSIRWFLHDKCADELPLRANRNRSNWTKLIGT